MTDQIKRFDGTLAYERMSEACLTKKVYESGKEGKKDRGRSSWNELDGERNHSEQG